MARVLLGVTGGIAAYKAVELVRLATGAGHAVRVIQTPASLDFVGRATFEAVTGAPVLVSELERDPARGAFPGEAGLSHDPISHLELVRRCDVLTIAPATANTISKLAAGLADNLLLSAALAARVPLVLAPAMNDAMYEHPATRENLETLRLRGATIVPPGTGALASKGEWGVGRLADPAEILAAVEATLREVAGPGFAPRSLDGLRVLVTAGGTREPIDAVRYVGNRSSGRMGRALAAEASRRGAEVTLIAANVSLEAPAGVRRVDVETAAELRDAVRAEFPESDALLMAAAVSDFRPRAPETSKISKRSREGLELVLEPTPDVLGELAAIRRPGQTVIGFAAEHAGARSGAGGFVAGSGAAALASARDKLQRKSLDAIVLNDVSRAGVGFEADENEVTIVTAAAERPVPRGPKSAVAAAVIDEVEGLRAGSRDGPTAATGEGKAAREGSGR